jgi:predicted transcriptional regulator
MIEIPTPRDVRRLAIDATISIPEACRRAGLMPKVFTEWERARTNPGIENVRKIVAELQKALKDG